MGKVIRLTDHDLMRRVEEFLSALERIYAIYEL